MGIGELFEFERTGRILPENETKGEKYGRCNRSSCGNRNATYYNHSTRKYYCENCADTINYENHHDSMKLFGHELCTKDE